MKTKKTKLFVFLAVLLCLIAPIFSGCDGKIKLNKPGFINYQVSRDGEQMLITDNNIYASSFVFGISTTYENEDTSNFLTYKCDKHYFSVTDLFVNAQTYYFYAQAVGGGDYVTSDISEVKSITVTYKLDAPVLELSGTTLSWTEVQNADKYIIYANDVVVTEVSTNSYNFAEYLQTQNSGIPYTFSVACKQNNNYLKSAKSNEKTYTDHLFLSTPTNLRVLSGKNKTLTWNPVANCNKYIVSINDSIQKEVYTNQLNLSEYYTQVGTYTFKVMAVGEGHFKSSGYSQTLTDKYTIPLSTPTDLQSAMGTDYIILSWSQIENASEYALYFNNTRFYLNQGTGVNSPIVTNSVIIKKQDLISYDLSTLSFRIQALGVSGGYYTNSELSATAFIDTTLLILSAPSISIDEANGQVAISKVAGAVLYQIDYTLDGQSGNPVYINASNNDYTYFNYNVHFVEIGNYTLKVKAIAENEILNSSYSNQVSFEILPPVTTLTAPQINDVYVSGDNLVVDFEKMDENSQTFSLTVNDILINTNLSSTYNYVNLDTLFGIIGQTSSISVYLTANQTDEYHLASEKSNTVTVETNLETPNNLKLNGSVLSWNAVKNAQTYYLVLDDKFVNLNSSNNSVNLANYVATNATRQVMLYAYTNYFTPSNFSNSLIFNNVSVNLSGYTDKYFYYGQTYDYYITSELEIIDAVRYVVDNFIEESNFYFSNYDNSLTIAQKVDSAFDYLTVSHNFDPSVDASGNYGYCTLEINFYNKSTYQAHTPQYTQYSNILQYKSTTGRDADYEFVSDSYVVSQDVYESDGLVSALEHRAVPNFVTKNSSAESIYNQAKQILLQICDDNMTDYQKALAIHDYVAVTITYDFYGLENKQANTVGYYHYLESIFDYGLAVCDGYAKLFSVLCNMEGIQTITISGSTDKNNIYGTGHAWNKIYLDADNNGTKEWYSVDCTWDDAQATLDGQKYEVLSHSYFMIPDSYIAERYESVEYPKSTSADALYYDTHTIDGNILRVENLMQLQAIVNYVKANNVYVEILFNKNISLIGVSFKYYSFGYDFDNKYSMMFICN